MMKLAVYRYLNYLCIVSRLNKNQFNVLNIEIVCSNSLSYMEIVELAVLIKVAQTMGTHACISSTYMYLKSLTILKIVLVSNFILKAVN